jgi:putative hydrolase of the HAD superfamily
MVEDSIDNLRTARRLGMKTVLVSRTGAPAWVDVGVKSVLELPRQIGRL